MRDFAIDVLKDEVDTEVIATPEQPVDGSAGPLNPFALGLPLLLLGVILALLFPPLGLAMAGIGAFMCVIGVGMAIIGRRSREKGPGEEDS